MTFHRAGRKDHGRNPSKRTVSVEIEVASTEEEGGISDTVRRWRGSIVHDCSLPDTGFEINTAPASGDLFPKQISEITAALEEAGADVNKSCGLHVHVSAADFRYFEVRRLIMLYARIEDALFRMVHARRRSNDYCKRCGPYYLSRLSGGKECKKSLVKMTYPDSSGKAIQHARNEKYQGWAHDRRRQHARYNALNLHSWFYRGTIECRLFDGTVNPDEIIPWGILWAGILDWAYQHTERDIAALPIDSLEALLAVSPTEEVRGFIRAQTARYN